MIFLLLSSNEYLLVNPSCLTCRENCHGRPNNKCPACIGITYNRTSSSYFPMQKETNTCLFTFASPLSLSHCNLKGQGCLIVGSPNFSTIVVLATLIQLPLFNNRTTYLVLYMTSSMKDVLSLHVVIFFDLHT